MSEDTGRILVCYATGTGCTKGVAARIGETLARTGARVDVAAFESAPDPAGYVAVIAGSGVRAGSWHPKAKKWMARNAVALAGRPLALFTVGIALADGPQKAEEMRGYTKPLLAKTGLVPVDVGVFAGWFRPETLNVLERKIMRIANAPEGDFRDWDAIEGWAIDVAHKLAPADRVAAA
jgi:menaquinone-dependent protoporphyrinogen oxidase